MAQWGDGVECISSNFEIASRFPHPPCRAPSPILRTGEGETPKHVAFSCLRSKWEKVAEGRMRGLLKIQLPRLSNKVLAEAVVRFLLYKFE